MRVGTVDTSPGSGRPDTAGHLASGHGGSLPYIPAVDGLRAVAVLSVILYHLRAGLLPGGFVGVDIFFVISGFVVTGSLLGYRPARRSDLFFYFYARRLVRIAPALIVCLLATALVVSLIVPSAWLSDTMDRVGRSAFFGFSNIVLSLQSDTYFSPRGEYNPYLHTWSLGVEEQFYFLFPFLLLLERRLARHGRSSLATAVLLVLIVLSLAASAVLTVYQPRHAFYMMPPRFWELGTGMMLCMTLPRWRPAVKNAGKGGEILLGGGALAALALCFARPDIAGFPFPLALLPVLASAALIALVSSGHDGVFAAMLGARTPVAIGKRSYSLYLWHFPVFVLFRWTVGLETLATALAALGLIAALGALSFRFVEQGVRKNRWIARQRPRTVVVFGVAILLASTAACIVIMKSRARLSQSVTASTNLWYATEDRPLRPQWTHCALQKSERAIVTGSVKSWTPSHCDRPMSGRRLIAIGDSHTLAYIPMLRQYAAATGTPVTTYFATGCPFLNLRTAMGQDRLCAPYYAAAAADIERTVKPGDIVFLASLRLSRFVDQWGGTDGTQAAGNGPVDPAVSAEGEAILRRFTTKGATVVFEAPLPLFRSPPFRCSDWFNRMNPICRKGGALPRRELDTLRRPVLDAMHRLAARIPGVSIWDPAPSLCGAAQCPIATAEGPLFFDADHISGMGNDRLYPSFSRFMNATGISGRTPGDMPR